MHCESCGRDGDPNRVVVDTVTEELLGGFCSDCETDLFGASLEGERWTRADRCALCNRDAYFNLAGITLRVVTDAATDRSEQLETTVAPASEAPGLCDEHYHTIFADSVATASEEPPGTLL